MYVSDSCLRKGLQPYYQNHAEAESSARVISLNNTYLVIGTGEPFIFSLNIGLK